MPDPAHWQATPEQVAEGQRADVAHAVRELGASASVLTVSGRTYLHPSIVVRRLRELGAEVPGMDWKPVRVPRTAGQKAEATGFLVGTQRAAGG